MPSMKRKAASKKMTTKSMKGAMKRKGTTKARSKKC